MVETDVGSQLSPWLVTCFHLPSESTDEVFVPVRMWRCPIAFMCFAAHRQKTQSHKAVLLPGLVLPGVLSPAVQGLAWPL